MPPPTPTNNKKIKLLVVDDNEMTRCWFEEFVLRHQFIEQSFIVSSADMAINCMKRQPVDVIIMDVFLGNGTTGYALTEKILFDFPEVKIIGFSSFTDNVSGILMLNAGCTGLVTKKTEDQLFIGAIKSVLNKHLFFDPCLPATVFKNHIARKNENEIMAMSLDEMEIDIIKLVCRNFNEEMIASEINRSVDTVEGRIKKIATKLNTSGIRGVALAAIKIGMVSPEHISAEPHAREKNNHEPKSKK